MRGYSEKEDLLRFQSWRTYRSNHKQTYHQCRFVFNPLWVLPLHQSVSTVFRLRSEGFPDGLQEFRQLVLVELLAAEVIEVLACPDEPQPAVWLVARLKFQGDNVSLFLKCIFCFWKQRQQTRSQHMLKRETIMLFSTWFSNYLLTSRIGNVWGTGSKM